MARKIKRMSRKELRETDQVMSKLEGFYDKLRKYRMHLLLGVVGLFVLLFVISGLLSWRVSSAQGVVDAFDPAYRALTARVIPPQDLADIPGRKRDLGEVFPTDADKARVATERVNAFLADNGGTALGNTAALGLAGIQVDQSDWEKAAQGMQAYLEAEPHSPVAPYVMETLGLLALQRGKSDEASTWFNKLVELGSPYYQALGHSHLGDLANPRFGATGDAAAAKKAYETALSALKKDDGALPPTEQELHDELERKVALVEIPR